MEARKKQNLHFWGVFLGNRASPFLYQKRIHAFQNPAACPWRVFILFFHNDLGGGEQSCQRARTTMEKALRALKGMEPVGVPALLLDTDDVTEKASQAEVCTLPFHYEKRKCNSQKFHVSPPCHFVVFGSTLFQLFFNSFSTLF